MVLVSSRDVSERHRAQAALIEQGRLAAALQNERELSALKNQVMERISHEFRTPLAVIATAASLVQRYSNQMSEQRREEHLGTIQQQVEHLSEVLTDILRVMKGNEYPVYRVVIPLEPLLQTLVASFRAKHPERHIQYHNASVLAEGRIDPDLLQDIVEPLLTNALKYSDTASSISLSAERQQNMLILHIRDQGIGIPMPDQAHVTQAFFRASNIDERSGLGLGLRIAKDAAQRLGGTLEIQSVEGAGTTVTVRLPLSD
jgi:two-component system, sensor histidine kinase and response regulator